MASETPTIVEQQFGDTLVLHVGTQSEIQASGLLAIFPALGILLQEPCLSLLTHPLTRGKDPAAFELLCTPLQQKQLPTLPLGCTLISDDSGVFVFRNDFFLIQCIRRSDTTTAVASGNSSTDWNVQLQNVEKTAKLPVVISIPVQEEPYCAQCIKTKDITLRCSKCHVVSYCSKTCQHVHWRTQHKTECTVKEELSAGGFPCFSPRQLSHLFQRIMQQSVSSSSDRTAGISICWDLFMAVVATYSDQETVTVAAEGLRAFQNFTQEERDVALALLLTLIIQGVCDHSLWLSVYKCYPFGTAGATQPKPKWFSCAVATFMSDEFPTLGNKLIDQPAVSPEQRALWIKGCKRLLSFDQESADQLFQCIRDTMAQGVEVQTQSGPPTATTKH